MGPLPAEPGVVVPPLVDDADGVTIATKLVEVVVIVVVAVKGPGTG